MNILGALQIASLGLQNNMHVLNNITWFVDLDLLKSMKNSNELMETSTLFVLESILVPRVSTTDSTVNF